MELDFSKLDGLAYRGFTSEAARDTLIEQGFMVIEGDISPFNAPETLEGQNKPNTPTPALKRELEPSAGIPAMQKAAAEYKERHPLPQHPLDYWEEALRDLRGVAKQYGNDPQMLALLRDAYGELEKEYSAREAAYARAASSAAAQ